MDVPLDVSDPASYIGKAVNIPVVFPGNQKFPSPAGDMIATTDILHLYCNENVVRHCLMVVKLWTFQDFCIERCRFNKSKIFDSAGISWTICSDLLVSMYDVKDV